MSDDLVLNVKVNGADPAANALDRVGASVSRTASTWDRLKTKLGSGEVLRNAAASAALLATGAGNTTDKVAALGGALASIPGPVGLVASAVAIGATALGVFGKAAEQAERKAAELAATLANLGKQRGEAQQALAARVSGAAARLGGANARFTSAGGTAEGLAAAQRLTGGDAAGALNLGTQLAAGGLTEDQRGLAESTLRDVKAAGFELSKEVVARVIEGIKYEAEAFAGGAGPTDVREQQSNRLGRFLDAVGADSATRGALSDAGNAAFMSQGGNVGMMLRELAESPLVAEAAAQTRDVYGGGGTVASEALRVATGKATAATGELTEAIVDLTKKITETQGQQAGTPAAQAESAWIDAVFAYGRQRSKP